MSKEVKVKKQFKSVDNNHWKLAKRLWNLPIKLGTRNTNQVDKGLTAQIEAKTKI